MKWKKNYENRKLSLVTYEIFEVPVPHVYLYLFYEDAQNADKILHEIASDSLQVKLISEGRHPLQVLGEVFIYNMEGKNSKERRELYEFLKDNILHIMENEIFKEVYSFVRPYHEWNKVRTDFPYNIDEKLEYPLYVLNEILEVETYFSCQGVQTFIVVKGRKIFIPDGHGSLAYLSLESSDFVEKELIPFVQQRVDIRIERSGKGKVTLRTKRPEDNLNFVKSLHEFVHEIEVKETEWRRSISSSEVLVG